MLNFYYPRTTKGIINSVVSLFSSIKVYNFPDSISATPETSGTIGPIHPAIFVVPQSREYVDRTIQESGRLYNNSYPSISIELKSLNIDRERMVSVNDTIDFYNSIYSLNSLTEYFTTYPPIPTNFNFNIKIRVNILDHLNQILENLVPYFNSTFVFQVREFSFLNIKRELAIQLDNEIPFTYDEELEQNKKREVFSDLSLVVKGFMYRPINSEAIIKIINSSYFINEFDTSGSTTSPQNILKETFSTSGFPSTPSSAFPSKSQFNLSAFDPSTNTWGFTSALSYP